MLSPNPVPFIHQIFRSLHISYYSTPPTNSPFLSNQADFTIILTYSRVHKPGYNRFIGDALDQAILDCLAQQNYWVYATPTWDVFLPSTRNAFFNQYPGFPKKNLDFYSNQATPLVSLPVIELTSGSGNVNRGNIPNQLICNISSHLLASLGPILVP